jgi:mannose-6-phosphate isomerase
MPSARAQVKETHRQLLGWLFDAALPLWWSIGADHNRGGFHEAIALDGEPMVDLPRRARVQPRQIYCYAQAKYLGWTGPADAAIEHGLSYFLNRYRRSDGSYRTLVAPDGTVLDDSVVLYDQAFALLGLAAAYSALGRPKELESRAIELRAVLLESQKHPIAGFWEFQPPGQLLANPHMHLLEACLEWDEADGDSGWLAIADEIARLAMRSLIDGDSGAIREHFEGDWTPVTGTQGRVIEPGHQYEWAWLLMRWSARHGASDVPRHAERMIEFSDRYGVDQATGAAWNTLDGRSVVDSGARLWPQTERIKSHARLASVTGSERNWSEVSRSCAVLLDYLAVPVRGLWRDRVDTDGKFRREPAPASSFYHIVCALAELTKLLDQPGGARNADLPHEPELDADPSAGRPSGPVLS